MKNNWSYIKKNIVNIITVLLAAMSPSAFADWQINMPRGVTPVSHDIFDLHMLIFWVCVGIGIIVFSVMIYSIIMHRKAKGHKAADFHENMRLEIAWAIIPFIILVAMAIPATRVLMSMDDSSDADVTIKVIGQQWKWKYEYLDQGISYYSNLATSYDQLQNKVKKDKHYLLEVDRPLVLPINKKIRFLVTSNDVIHSWWVPDLGIKRDAIPGFIHEAWARIEKPGIYRGQCAELCGVHHGFMPIVIKAVTDEEFKQWVTEQTSAVSAAESKKVWTKDELMTLGKQKYENTCTVCHKSDGSGMPPVFPALKGSSVAVGKSVSRHINIILHGVPGSAMQAFASQLSDIDIAAIVTYERNAWGNNTGDVIQPAEVLAVRQGKTSSPLVAQKPVQINNQPAVVKNPQSNNKQQIEKNTEKK